MSKPFISVTSDFGVQTQGVGLMEAAALRISPDANFVHLMHGLPSFDLIAAARTLESVQFMPVGAHVCVCDPGVGTDRKAIACEVVRGDFIIGPDNGVLIPSTRVLGGIKHVIQITNQKYMNDIISPIFHGRDIFIPVAAHLVNGVSIFDIGITLEPGELVIAPYEEAQFIDKKILAQIIQINKFGSIHLNISHTVWDSFARIGETVQLDFGNHTLQIPFCQTFGNVKIGHLVILKDDYGRVEVAINQGSFSEGYSICIGDIVEISK